VNRLAPTGQTPFINALVTITGWGNTDPNSSTPAPRLKVGDARVTSTVRVGNPPSDYTEIVSRRSNAITGYGDSGGPVISGDVQTGVHSSIDANAIMYAVSVGDPRVRNWIRSESGV
jgi:hypothetical protein